MPPPPRQHPRGPPAPPEAPSLPPPPSQSNLSKRGLRVLDPKSPPPIAMALSSSIAQFRRILRVSPSSFSSLLKWNIPFSQNCRSSSFLNDLDTSDKNLPPLTTPKLFVSGSAMK